MEIATPVCGLVRNDREFDKFQFVGLLSETDERFILYLVSPISYLTIALPALRAVHKMYYIF